MKTFSITTKTFSQDPKVRRIQELLPELRMAPSNVKNAALLLASYFRPIKAEKTYGVGMDPGKWPFIYINDVESFTEFQAAISTVMGRKIKKASFGRGKYIMADSNVINKEFDETDFIISIPWLLEDEANYDKVIPDLIKFIESYPRLNKYLKFHRTKSKEWRALRTAVMDLAEELDPESKLEFKDLLSEYPKFRELYDKRNQLGDYLESTTSPKDSLKQQLKGWTALGKSWIDAYRGFSSDVFSVTLT